MLYCFLLILYPTKNTEAMDGNQDDDSHGLMQENRRPDNRSLSEIFRQLFRTRQLQQVKIEGPCKFTYNFSRLLELRIGPSFFIDSLMTRLCMKDNTVYFRVFCQFHYSKKPSGMVRMFGAFLTRKKSRSFLMDDLQLQ